MEFLNRLDFEQIDFWLWKWEFKPEVILTVQLTKTGWIRMEYTGGTFPIYPINAEGFIYTLMRISEGMGKDIRVPKFNEFIEFGLPIEV